MDWFLCTSISEMKLYWYRQKSIIESCNILKTSRIKIAAVSETKTLSHWIRTSWAYMGNREWIYSYLWHTEWLYQCIPECRRDAQIMEQVVDDAYIDEAIETIRLSARIPLEMKLRRPNNKACNKCVSSCWVVWEIEQWWVEIAKQNRWHVYEIRLYNCVNAIVRL